MAFVSRAATTRRSVPWIGATTRDPWGLMLLAFVYIKVYFEFRLYKTGDAEIDTSGSTMTQVMWLGLFAFAGLVIWRNRAEALVLIQRAWPLSLPFLWFAATYFWTPEPLLTTRRLILLVLMAGISFSVAVARPSPSDFLKVSLLVLGSILFLNLLSVFAVPHLARGGDSFHGLYGSKNTAGAVAAVIFVFWLFAVFWARQFEYKIVCLFGTLLWLFFLVGTMSKTSIGAAAVTPLLGIGLYYILYLEMIWRVIAYAGVVVVTCIALWLGLLFNLTLQEVGIFIFEDLTFTNRTYLWEFIWRSIQDSFWLGHGFGAFWYVGRGVPNLLGADSGWAAEVTSAHNGYLNIWLEAGLVGLLLCGLTLLLALRGAVQLLKNPAASVVDRWVYALILAELVLMMLRDLMEASLFRAHSATTMMFFMFYFLVAMWRLRDQEDQASALRQHPGGRVVQ